MIIEIIIPFIYVLTVALHAGIDWFLIKKKNIAINHKTEIYYYAGFCAILFFLFLCTSSVRFYHLIFLPVLSRAAFFDPALNWFTGNSILYEGDPDKAEEKKSFFDRLEAWLGLPVIVYRIIYAAALTGYVIFYYTKL